MVHRGGNAVVNLLQRTRNAWGNAGGPGLKGRSKIVLAVVAGLIASVGVAAPAQAAFSDQCAVTAYAPTTDGIYMDNPVSATCTPGRTLGLIGAKGQQQTVFSWSDNYTLQTKLLSSVQSVNWFGYWRCNGVGTKTFRSFATATNSSAETSTSYSAGRMLGC